MQGPKELSYPLLLSQAIIRELEGKVEQLGHEPVAMWDACASRWRISYLSQHTGATISVPSARIPHWPESARSQGQRNLLITNMQADLLQLWNAEQMGHVVAALLPRAQAALARLSASLLFFLS